MSNYGCQQDLINANADVMAILEFLCGQSAKLGNCGTYYARQLYFKTGKIPSKFDLHKFFKNHVHFQAMYSHVAQQCLTTIAESFKSYIGLLKDIKKGSVEQHPRLLGYRKGGLALVTYPKADVKLKASTTSTTLLSPAETLLVRLRSAQVSASPLSFNPERLVSSEVEISRRVKDGLLRFPLGSKVKAWFGLDAFYLPMPSNLEFEDIKEFRIVPRNKCFYIESVYKKYHEVVNLDKSKVLGIDHGVNNWLTCVSNIGTSFIVDGKHLKSMNQSFNKQISTIKEDKPQGFWNDKLAFITEKRNRQVRDAVNKAARIVINYCLNNQIGTVVFGWNKGHKDGADMGKKNNQKFVQIPTARLKDRIAQLSKQYGIQFVETEESYTSKASFLDNDMLPKYGEKPVRVPCACPLGTSASPKEIRWQSSGRRVNRGLFRTANNFFLNADANGAANTALFR